MALAFLCVALNASAQPAARVFDLQADRPGTLAVFWPGDGGTILQGGQRVLPGRPEAELCCPGG